MNAYLYHSWAFVECEREGKEKITEKEKEKHLWPLPIDFYAVGSVRARCNCCASSTTAGSRQGGNRRESWQEYSNMLVWRVELLLNVEYKYRSKTSRPERESLYKGGKEE